MKLAILSDTHGLLRPQVEEHLKTCKDCRATLAAMDAPLPEAEKTAADDAAAVVERHRLPREGDHASTPA